MDELSERLASLPVGSLSEKGKQDYLVRLWKLLGEQTARYTMGDSSSVTVETATELLESICYTLDIALEKKGISRERLSRLDLDALLREGQELLLEETKSARRLWQRTRSCAVRIENAYYRETLEKTGGFFAHYDHLFFSHRSCPDLDYPLMLPVSEDVRGVSYVREYYRRLNMENRIINAFEPARVERLLCAAVPEYKNAFFNLCEQALVNAAGLAILRKDVRMLEVTEDECGLLSEILTCAGADGRRGALAAAAERLCRELGREDAELTAYAAESLSAALPRIESALTAGDASRVFVAFLPEGVGVAAEN